MYLTGCEATSGYPIVPLTDGQGVSIGMTTVGDRACFGVYSQAELAADADRLVRGINREIDELLELSGMVEERRKPAAAAGSEVGGEAGAEGGAAECAQPNGSDRPRRAAPSARLADSHEPRA